MTVLQSMTPNIIIANCCMQEEQIAVSPFPTLTILVGQQEAYQFMLRCGSRATLGSIIAALEKTYHAALGGRRVFKDKECSIEAYREEKIHQASSFFMGLSQDEHENAIKALFLPKESPISSPPSKQQPPSTQQGSTNIAEEGNNETEKKKDVSSFKAIPQQPDRAEEIPNKPIRNEQIQPQSQKFQQYYKPAEARYQKGQKINPEVIETSNGHLQTTDSLVRPQPVTTGSCCALI